MINRWLFRRIFDIRILYFKYGGLAEQLIGNTTDIVGAVLHLGDFFDRLTGFFPYVLQLIGDAIRYGRTLSDFFVDAVNIR